MKKFAYVFSFVVLFASCNSLEIENIDFKIIAHRGYWQNAEGADNSIRGLQESASLGIDGVELDVYATKDDSLLVIHGSNHGGYDIGATDYQTLREIRLSNGELIPTFSEYLHEAKKYPNLLLLIELKTSEKYERIIQQYESMHVSNPVIFQAFNYKNCAELHKQYPKYRVLALGSYSNEKLIRDGLSGFSTEIYDLQNNPSFIGEANNKDLITAVWVIKTEKDLIWSVINGVKYIITDDPFTAINFRSEFR